MPDRSKDAAREAPSPAHDEPSVPSTVEAVVIGAVIGALLCVLNVLVLFRSGTPFGGAALVVLLAAVLLRLRSRLNQHRLLVAFSVASSGYFATAALDTGIVAIWLRTGTVPDWPLLVGIAVAANLAGIVIGRIVAGSFAVRQPLPYPTLQPAVILIDTAVRRAHGGGRVLSCAALVGGAVASAGILTGTELLPLAPLKPPWLGVALSPLLLGLGALIGSRASISIAAGSLYSGLVWQAQGESVPFGAHLALPAILSIGVGLALGQSLVLISRISRPLAGAAAASARRHHRIAASAGGVLVAMLAWQAGVVGTIMLIAGMILLYTHLMNRVGGEAGFAPVAPVMYLSVAVFAVLQFPTQVALFIASSICCAAIGSVYYTFTVKVVVSVHGGSAAMPNRRIMWTQAVGGIAGSIVGVAFVLSLVHGGAVDGSRFPVPVAQAVSLVESSARHSASYASWVGIALAGGTILGALLTFTPALPTMLGLGVLLPPAFGLTIALGGLARMLLLRRRPEWKIQVDQAASGLIIGEGVVVIAALVAGRLIT
ncbi:hypothetical protein [Spirillospora sp. NPDC047279]|uniref:hypothetical protein n=1 Tax=Spirillospora sp. NPDC047279 TaxID=3155478 RepID=UPI0033EAF7CD